MRNKGSSDQRMDDVETMLKTHRSIRELRGRIERLFKRRPSAHTLGKIRLRLISLHNLLKSHFVMEESIGILQDMLHEFPQIQSAVRTLFGEHEALMKTIAALCQKTGDIRPHAPLRFNSLREEFTLFAARLSSHENKEAELVSQTHNLDLGMPG